MTTVERSSGDIHSEIEMHFCPALHSLFLKALYEGEVDPTESAICPSPCEGGEIQDFHVLGRRVPGMTRVVCTRPCEASSQNPLQTS